jgi:adenylylsulfate kinase-like enzyme
MPTERKTERGQVVWITGLSGAGKTTVAQQVVQRLRAEGKSVIFLDGDELREVFGAITPNEENHGREGRINLAMQYSRLCGVLASQGFTVVIATISLFREVHEWNRRNLPGYFEVYLKVPLKELRRRDPKGIYRKHQIGELKHVAGLDLEIDEPKMPDLIVEYTPKKSISDTAEKILENLVGGKVK